MILSKEDKQFIIELSKEMKTQDNRCTAQPYGLTLLEEVERLTPDGYSDGMLIIWDDDSYYEDDFSDLKESLLECFSENKDECEEIYSIDSFEHLASWMDMNISSGLTIVPYRRGHEVKTNNFNFFLTEKAYHEHIRQNGHNLNKPKSYGIHLYRNDEMAKVYEIIHKLAEGFGNE
jgi:hypothetical protein